MQIQDSKYSANKVKYLLREQACARGKSDLYTVEQWFKLEEESSND